MSVLTRNLKRFSQFAGIKYARNAILLIVSAATLAACSGGSKRP